MVHTRLHRPRGILSALCTLAVWAVLCSFAHAAEHVTLKNGFELDCGRHESAGNKVRLYLTDPAGNSANYLEVDADAIVRVEILAEKTFLAPSTTKVSSIPDATAAPTTTEMTELLAKAGRQHHIDADMLASVVKAESGGQVRAVSRTGAKGLMQLMPATAAHLGVTDAFRADQNIAGGTEYLDELLTRYHDDIALALAAYNAGPGAVDHWHGIPPYRETQEYVARVIREFNRRKMMALTANGK